MGFWHRLAALGAATVCLSSWGASAVPVQAASLVTAPYTVVSGDSSYRITQLADGSLADFLLVNRLTETSMLYPGEKVALPLRYRVDAHDQLSYLAARYDTTVSSIRSFNHLAGTRLSAGQVLLIARGSRGVSNAAVQARSRTMAVGTNAGMNTYAMVATAYDATAASNGSWGAVDYFGSPLRFGDIAVDPAVIPLGSRVYVSGYDDPFLPKNGFYARAVDEGGAIKGDRIDIFMPQTAEALQFGIQHVTLRVVR